MKPSSYSPEISITKNNASILKFNKTDEEEKQSAAAADAAAATSETTFVHVVFSTDCSTFQNWQSIVLFYSAAAVGQPGPVTRIASGCSEPDQIAVLRMHSKLDFSRNHPSRSSSSTSNKRIATSFHVHFTPDYSVDRASGKKYLFYNKPHGLLHWLEHGSFRNDSDGNVVVALLDPDMLFLRPITGLFPLGHFLVSPDWKPGEGWKRVEKGRPAGQQYGLGAHWLNFNRKYVCGGAGSPCVSTTPREANKYFPVGPPYVVHVDDLRNIAKSWVEMVPRIYEEYPELLAEMYAYCMAAAHLGLKHFKVDHMMVSNVDASGEGWPWVDAFLASPHADLEVSQSTVIEQREQKQQRQQQQVEVFTGDMPSVVHYCQNYRQSDWLFAKRRLPKGSAMTWPPPKDSILHCAHPLLAEPPENLTTANFFDHNDGTKKPLKPRQMQRVNFVLVTVIRGINKALEAFKEDVCDGGGGGDQELRRFSELGGESNLSEDTQVNLQRSFRLVPEHVERKALAAAKKQQREIQGGSDPNKSLRV
eukprot:CAMPEP_0171934422 /NCGR_PEP_ID=MMETSP0993-20121228/32004_1 /TAXON_ID=483369 /ORGANISM="non described non described, Strain CCMP2098" /LENGTH=532 /DNA_ID=CAMNT_0012575125 /DNA_START=203 /DNA_END=1801 /DNA_ORIENTATION=+